MIGKYRKSSSSKQSRIRKSSSEFNACPKTSSWYWDLCHSYPLMLSCTNCSCLAWQIRQPVRRGLLLIYILSLLDLVSALGSNKIRRRMTCPKEHTESRKQTGEVDRTKEWQTNNPKGKRVHQKTLWMWIWLHVYCHRIQKCGNLHQLGDRILTKTPTAFSQRRRASCYRRNRWMLDFNTNGLEMLFMNVNVEKQPISSHFIVHECAYWWLVHGL